MVYINKNETEINQNNKKKAKVFQNKEKNMNKM